MAWLADHRPIMSLDSPSQELVVMCFTKTLTFGGGGGRRGGRGGGGRGAGGSFLACALAHLQGMGLLYLLMYVVGGFVGGFPVLGS
jgi:hypothetical protein